MSRPAHSGALLHDTASGLDYRIHSASADKANSLVVLLHGVGGNESNLAALADLLPEDALIVLPRGPLSLSPGQFGWFQVAFTAEGPRINPSQAEAARLQLLALIASLQSTTGVTPERTLMAGFSQGGIMSASVALTSPRSLAGFGILSGRILPEIAAQLAPTPALSHLRAFISHGNQDSTLPPAWADRSETWVAELGIPAQACRYSARHELTREMAEDFVRWSRALLSPPPLRLHLDENVLSLESGTRKLELAAGTAQITTRHFQDQPPSPGELEAAIQTIEDALMACGDLVDTHTLVSSDAWLLQLARFAGCSPERIDRDQVETCFNRLAALSEGHPLTQDPLPDDPQFPARLLILRELMHHLDFSLLRTG